MNVRNSILSILLLIGVCGHSQTYLFDNPTCKIAPNHVCSSQFEIINDNKLEPTNGVYYYRIGHADYDGVYKDLLRIYVERTILDSIAGVFPEFSCIQFRETNDRRLAHFDFRIGQNIGDKAPEPPRQFGDYTLAYTWGVYGSNLDYLNQIWINYDALVWLDKPITTLMHEVLHRFNIDHSDIEDAIMFYALGNQTKWHQDDKDAINEVYGGMCKTADTPCDTIYLSDVAEILRLNKIIESKTDQLDRLNEMFDELDAMHTDLFNNQLKYIDVYRDLFKSKYRLGKLNEDQIVLMANNIGLVATAKDRKRDTCNSVWDELNKLQ